MCVVLFLQQQECVCVCVALLVGWLKGVACLNVCVLGLYEVILCVCECWAQGVSLSLCVSLTVCVSFMEESRVCVGSRHGRCVFINEQPKKRHTHTSYILICILSVLNRLQD